MHCLDRVGEPREIIQSKSEKNEDQIKTGTKRNRVRLQAAIRQRNQQGRLLSRGQAVKLLG
jgi:hypothetical protein